MSLERASLQREYDDFYQYIEENRVITEADLKLFIKMLLGKPSSLLRKIKVSREIRRFFSGIPLTVKERYDLQCYCDSFLPTWYRIGLRCGETCLLFGVVTLGNIVTRFIFSRILCH